MPNPHLQINKDFETLGRRLGRLLRSSFKTEDTSWADEADTMLSPYEGYEDGYDFDKLNNVLTRAWTTGTLSSHASFNDAYRATFPYTDEFVSTASVRHLLIGMAQEIHQAASDLSLTPADLQLLRNIASRLFHGVSRIRFPTRYMGVNSADGSAFGLHPKAPQHDHAMGTATRGNGAAKFHSRFDLRRRLHVLNSMNSMLAANNTSVSAIFKRAGGEAIRHSTRRMSASTQAMNQIVNLDRATAKFMDSWRQTLKDFAAFTGIPVTKKIPQQGKDPTRDYDLGASTDSLSYDRADDSSEADEDELVSFSEDEDLGEYGDLSGDWDEEWDSEDPPEEDEEDGRMDIAEDWGGDVAEAAQSQFDSFFSESGGLNGWGNIDFMNYGRDNPSEEEFDMSGLLEPYEDQNNEYLNSNGEETGDWPNVGDLPAPNLGVPASPLPSLEADVDMVIEFA